MSLLELFIIYIERLYSQSLYGCRFHLTIFSLNFAAPQIHQLQYFNMTSSTTIDLVRITSTWKKIYKEWPLLLKLVTNV